MVFYMKEMVGFAERNKGIVDKRRIERKREETEEERNHEISHKKAEEL